MSVWFAINKKVRQKGAEMCVILFQSTTENPRKMRSKERRKVNSQFSTGFGIMAKRSAAGILAAICVFAATGRAQKADEAPALSVFRKNVGIVSYADGKKSVHLVSNPETEAVAGDFDADGQLDTGTFDHETRLWTVRKSSDNSTLAVNFPRAKGKLSERPAAVLADFDGDGRTDMAVWCAGAWQVMPSSKGHAVETIQFGTAGDVPVPADFDGDSLADLAVFRPAENRWFIRSSETGAVRTADFGIAGTDLLVPADLTGDGKADIAVYRGGVWHYINSETGEEEQFDFGFEDARPVPGDFNRDGEIDFAVFRKGTWYVYDGSRLVSYKFGSEDDIPLSSVPVKESIAGR